MERLFLLFPLAGSLLANPLGEVEDFFPTKEIDFFLKPSTVFEGNFGTLKLVDYKIVPLGGSIYRLDMDFRGEERRHKEKLFGVIKVEIVNKPVERKVSVDFWYRGGRFIFFQTPEGIKLFDTQPRCSLKRQGEDFVFSYLERKTTLNLQGGRLKLVFEFTDCGF